MKVTMAVLAAMATACQAGAISKAMLAKYAEDDKIRGTTPDDMKLVQERLKMRPDDEHLSEFDEPDEQGDLIDRGELFEGDISASFEEIVEEFGEKLAVNLEKIGLVSRAKDRQLGTSSVSSHLWKVRSGGRVVVPWRYDASSTFSAAQKTIISDALADLAADTGVLTFVYRTTQTDYIEITSGSGCWSKVGRQGGRQQLNLQPNGCVSTGIVQHEFMHAIGFWHEQSRPDRDAFVDIVWGNIPNDKKHNFEKRSSSNTQSLGSAYDYGSVMHYGAYAFSSNGGKTIEAHGNAIGQRSGASESDITQIQLMYQCPAGPRNYVSFCTPDCPCNSGQGDCDSNADCKGSLVCEFGWTGKEKCRSIWDRCSPQKPCPENAGDCDSNADCQGSLVCQQQSGVDICVRPENTPFPTPFPTSPTPFPTRRPTLDIGVITKQPTFVRLTPRPTQPPIRITLPPIGFTSPPISFTPPPIGFTPPPFGFTPPPIAFTVPPISNIPSRDESGDEPAGPPSDAASSTASAEPGSSGQAGNSNNNNMAYYAAGGSGALVLAAAGVALVAVRRRKASAAAGQSPVTRDVEAVVAVNPNHVKI